MTKFLTIWLLTFQPVPVCEVCQFMVESVNDQLHGSGEEEVVGTFERVCSQMPQQEQQFVSTCTLESPLFKFIHVHLLTDKIPQEKKFIMPPTTSPKVRGDI